MDRRSRRVCFLAHCLLNQNSVVEGLARYPAFVKDLLDTLHEFAIGIVQLPCPETKFIGLRRFWHVREQYAAIGFRKFCRELVRDVVDLIEEYIRCGYEVVFIMGIRGSPSCGVYHTSSGTWFGCPWEIDRRYVEVEGSGVFMEELIRELKSRGILIDFLEFDYGNPKGSVAEVRKFLESRSR